MSHLFPRSKRIPLPFSLLFLLLCVHAPAQAQDARVSFTLDFPGSEPAHYVIVVSSDGQATYESDGKIHADAESTDAFHVDFTASPATRARIFDLSRRARYFDGDIDSKKKNLAMTGTKTLTYSDAQRSFRATYNYSPISAVQELTQLFQNLSSTLEFRRRLEYYYRYQKLALDDEMKRMEEMSNQNSLEDMGAAAPILRQIAADPSVINPVRARAQRLLERVGAASR